MEKVYISVDIESDGLVAGIHSMVAIGAVVVEMGFKRTFYSTICPVSNIFNSNSLRITGFNREETLTFPLAEVVIPKFANWLLSVANTPVFVGDNPAFDFAFINWYFYTFYGKNPFGHKGYSITDLYKGLKRDINARSSHLKRTVHDHNALNDAMGNAEVLLEIADLIKIII